MTFNISVKATGMQDAFAKFKKLHKVLSNPDPATNAALHLVGGVFQTNFIGEGGLVGGWHELAQRTQDERASLGYSPAHPILIRYGDLQRYATTFLTNASENDSAGRTDSQGKSIYVTVSTSGGRAEVLATGEKAANQVGSGTLPARPYWFVNSQVLQAGKQGVMNWLIDEIGKL